MNLAPSGPAFLDVKEGISRWSTSGERSSQNAECQIVVALKVGTAMLERLIIARGTAEMVRLGLGPEFYTARN